MQGVDNWEDLLSGDEEVEQTPSQTPSAQALKKQEQKKIDEEYARDVFNDLLGEPTNTKTNNKTKVDKKNMVFNENKETRIEDLLLDSYKNCEIAANAIAASIQVSTCKSESLCRFIDILLKASFNKMNPKELTVVSERVKAYEKEAKQKKTSLTENKKEATAKASTWSKNKIQDELDMFYGEEENDYDSEDEDSDDYMFDVL